MLSMERKRQQRSVDRCIAAIASFDPNTVLVERTPIMGTDEDIQVRESPSLMALLDAADYLLRREPIFFAQFRDKLELVLSVLPPVVTDEWLYSGDMFAGTSVKDYEPYVRLRNVLEMAP